MTFPSKSVRSLNAFISAFVLVSLQVSTAAFADQEGGAKPTERMTIRAKSCHGANVYNGQQVSTWDALRASWGDDVPQAAKDFWAAPYAFREMGVQGDAAPSRWTRLRHWTPR